MKIISGGQTGIDQLALEIAKDLKYVTGGTSCKGWLTEKGNQRALLQSYGLTECSRAGYPARTIQNVRDSDLTIILSDNIGPGSALTIKSCDKFGKPYLHNPTPEQVIDVLMKLNKGDCITINFAGARGSRLPDPDRYKKLITSILIRCDITKHTITPTP